MRSLLVLVVTVTVALAAPATAQDLLGSFFSFGGAGVRPISQTGMNVQSSGALTVDFHGDRGAGCATYGVCGYAGTVTWSLGSSGGLEIEKYRARGRTGYAAFFFAGQSGPLTAAHVTRAGHDCVDANTAAYGPGISTVHGGFRVRLLPPGIGVLSTRCAGPLDEDLASVNPEQTLTTGEALRGSTTVDLSGTHSFVGHGFVGVSRSSVVLRLGRPRTTSIGAPRPIGAINRVRELTENLTFVHGAGHMSASFTGGADAQSCQLLDSCGARGTVSWGLQPSHVSASVIAVGPARRPLRDFRRALGLGAGGSARGIDVRGFVSWDNRARTLERFTQGALCRGTGLTANETFVFIRQGGHWSGVYYPSNGRTGCPGPDLRSATATVSVAANTLARRAITLHVAASSPFADDGYNARAIVDLSFKFRRGRLTQSRFPGP